MDYYELLGVDEDAPVDDIRAAYRDKKAEVDGRGTEDAKADAAALNKAWNVLSDPYQRGRYDQQRATVAEAGADDDDEEEAAPARSTRSTRAVERAEARRGARVPLKPTVTLPAGTAFPATRRRLTAMAIDLGVLLVLFVASQFLAVAIEKANHPDVYKRYTDLSGTIIPDAHDAAKAANSKASDQEQKYAALLKSKGANAPDTQAALAAKKAADDAAKKAKDTEKAYNDELDAKAKVLAPTQNLVSGLFFLVALLVLFVPSLFGGQTLGKRLQHIRVVRLDGARAGAGALFRRYGALVLAAYVISFVLRSPVGALVVVFVATMWTRNPNQQALHDRFAKTLVVQ